MSSTKIKIVVPALFAFTATLAMAQSGPELPPGTATQQTIAVRITDQTGAAIRNAHASLLSAHGDVVSTLSSDDAGTVAASCKAGSLLQVRALGFESRTVSLGNCAADIHIRLAPAAVQTTINVVVTPDEIPNEVAGSSASISRTTARTVFDAVEDLSPAIYVTRRGVMGYGISTNGTGDVSIRGVGGAPNTDVLMVLDGRPDFQGEMGHTLPDFYSLSNAGNIRVIEGPASVLYGSNAIGGAIEVQPREPGANAEFELTSSLGSFMTGQHRLYAGIRRQHSLYTFSSGINHTDGDRAYSAYRSQDGSLGANYSLSRIWTAKLDGNYGHFYVQDPGPVTNAGYARNYASVGRGSFSADLANSAPLLTGYTRIYSTWGRNFISDGFRSTDRITGGRIYQTIPLPHSIAMDFGADLVNYGGLARQFNGTNYGGEHQINDDAGFVRAHYAPSAKSLFNAGLRYQANSQFGNIAVPEFGALWHASNRITLSGAISRGFRNPTIRELYLFPAPNSSLKPVHEWNYQATAQARITGALVGWTTFYYANMSNQILTLGKYPNMQLTNSGKAINKGVENNLRWALYRRVSMVGGYAFLRSTSLAPYVPGNKANLGMDVDLKRAFLHIGVQAIGRRYSDATSTTQMGGYTEASLKLSVPITKRLSFFGTADNLFNHRYQAYTGYPMPGANGSGGFVMHF
jgi:outer membrane receptor protein involved in Fe transport